MSVTNLLKNQTFPVDLSLEYGDQGWNISGGKAIHEGCNDGSIWLEGYPIAIGSSYIITCKVSDFMSGFVRANVGTAQGTQRITNGVFTETIICQGNTDFTFFASGNLSLEFLKIEIPNPETGDFITLSFNTGGDEGGNKYFQGWWSYAPDFMGIIGQQFLSWKNGELWKHNTNELRNNFYGVQYKSIVRFVSNLEPQNNKNYWNIKIDSTGRWAMPQALISANEKFPNGMKTRLGKNDFEQDEGKYWAHFFGDLNDPNFYTADDSLKPTKELEALFEGRTLQGCTISIELENTDSKEVKLNAVYIYSSELNRNF
jgi:hypothetical protein